MFRSMILVASTVATAVVAQVTITVPTSCPSDASAPIDSKFQGFAFEQASFVEYAVGKLETLALELEHWLIIGIIRRK